MRSMKTLLIVSLILLIAGLVLPVGTSAASGNGSAEGPDSITGKWSEGTGGSNIDVAGTFANGVLDLTIHLDSNGSTLNIKGGFKGDILTGTYEDRQYQYSVPGGRLFRA